jgi:HprK-related kinase A
VTPASDQATVARVGALGVVDFAERLQRGALGIRVGPFDIRLGSDADDLAPHLHALYADHPLLDDGQLFSCHLRLERLWRVLPRPGRYVRFLVDGVAPHEDMPAAHSLAVLEWGLNLVIALRCHRYLMLHAAVVERNGCALVLPAAPASGKTTLCAALVHRGWRLLSDEFGLVERGTLQFTPLPRPMPLKNESIEVLRAFAPAAVLGPCIEGTRKGTVAHVKPTTESVLMQHVPAQARWLVFPRWERDAALELRAMSELEAFVGVTANAFNYEVQGAAGFDTACGLARSSRSFSLRYSRLDEAVAALTALANEEDARAG